ncbi:MAG: carbohydrate kinase family protein [Anaerolineales bacterium]|nr:carbohydrate kinase family protein [Anaerolineales bacterium]
MILDEIRSLPPIIGIGDIVADVVVRIPTLPVDAEDFFLASDFEFEAGGTANFLIMAARLGAPAVALGSIGIDVWGNEVRNMLEAESIDMSLISAAGTTTRALVLVDEQGRHAFIGKFGQADDPGLSERQRKVLQGAGATFASGYSLSEMHLAEFTLQAMQIAGDGGAQRSFDPGPAYPGLPGVLKERVLALTDVLFVTEEELPAVSTAGVNALFDLGPRMVVIKRGKDGCRVYAQSGLVAEHNGFIVPVVDTTAAGDSFAAGFLTAITAGLPVDACARLGNAVGAAKVQKLGGGRNVPHLGDVRTILER